MTEVMKYHNLCHQIRVTKTIRSSRKTTAQTKAVHQVTQVDSMLFIP